MKRKQDKPHQEVVGPNDSDGDIAPQSASESRHGGITGDRDLTLETDLHWMQQAFELAMQAATEDEVPVGALIVRDHQIIGAAGNQCESLKDPTAHAEMIAITQAAATIEDWRLQRCTLYVTLEPCLMCSGAILQARIPRVVFGTRDPKAGAVASLYQVLHDERLNHQCQVTEGVMAEPCGRVLTEFFQSKRAMGKK